MTGTELAPMESFMKRVENKLRDDIGSMLPDDVVAEMVRRVIDKEFFTKTEKNTGSHHYPKVEVVPSGFQKMVLDASKPIIEKQVAMILLEHAEAIEKQIQETINAGIVHLAVNTIDKLITTALGDRSWQVAQTLQQAIDGHRRLS